MTVAPPTTPDYDVVLLEPLDIKAHNSDSTDFSGLPIEQQSDLPLMHRLRIQADNCKTKADEHENRSKVLLKRQRIFSIINISISCLVSILTILLNSVSIPLEIPAIIAIISTALSTITNLKTMNSNDAMRHKMTASLFTALSSKMSFLSILSLTPNTTSHAQKLFKKYALLCQNAPAF